jgi:CDP-diacylglycerol--glycerol-3-phosphate 3-phosphatidyltransferase
MPGPSLKALPNALTILRIILSALVFFLLAAAGGRLLPGPALAVPSRPWLWASALLYLIAAATDFFDGHLARRLGAVSPWGAILDPIADKIAIAAALLGLVLIRPDPLVAVPGFFILFREMFVSGLREGLAPMGVKIKVTQLAKWKTTVQLAALTLEIVAAGAPGPLRLLADLSLAGAAALTLVTGVSYLRGAAKALGPSAQGGR